MFCSQCGARVADGANFCNSCGSRMPAGAQSPATQPTAAQPMAARTAAPIAVAAPAPGNGQAPAYAPAYAPAQPVYQQAPMGRMGFSERINDPAFSRYVRNSNRAAGIFAGLLSLAAIVGFTIYGENSSEMDNPGAMFIGLGLAAMFMLIAGIQIASRNRDRTWDGSVVDKKVERKRERRNTGDDDWEWEEYTQYSVIVRSDEGKTKTTTARNSSDVYNYYNIGDRVRHHKGLALFEKYDKSRDAQVMCVACGNFVSFAEDKCPRCRVPLLK